MGGSNLAVKGISIFEELFNDVRTYTGHRTGQERTGQSNDEMCRIIMIVTCKVLIANQARDYKNSQGIINEDKQVLAFRAH